MVASCPSPPPPFIDPAMPFFSAQDKQPKCVSRPPSSLLRRFNDLYKPSTLPTSSPTQKSACTKLRTSLYGFEEPLHVSLFALDHHRSHHDFSGDSESNSSHSDASSSRQTLELSPAVEKRPSAYIAPQRPHIKPLRPALKQTTSWNSTSTRSTSHDLHVSFVIPTRRDPRLFAMHPLFEYTHLDHAPISCDIAYPPSPRSVLDRRTRTPIPDDTLDEPATEPARYTQLVLKCDLFPWEVVVRPGTGSPRPSPSSPSKRYPFTRRHPITNRDVLFALYNALAERATADEWASLGARSRAQRRISHAYEQRCVKLGGGWEAGVRRIDWLDGRTRLVGIALKEGPAGEPDTATLIFKMPV